MIHFDLPKEKSSIIKVVGVGGGGSNAVNHMSGQGIEGVNFIICNTDAQAIALSKVPNKIQLGPNLTQGLGAGANPNVGKEATEESFEEIKRILEVNTKMAFITAGMGGGTGTGGAPIVAKICKELGILTVGIVTTPFGYEGRKRMEQARLGIEALKEHVDTLLVINNDKLRHQYGNLRMSEAFAKADNVLATAAKCIVDVINSTGQMNVDFADVCTVMSNGGVAILGSAAMSGEDRAQQAIEEALSSPLLNDNDIRGAKWILLNITSAEGEFEHRMDEVDVINQYIVDNAGEGVDVIMGQGYDNTLGDKIAITLIATGFEAKDAFAQNTPPAPKVEKIVMPLQPATPKPQAIAPQETAAPTPMPEPPMPQATVTPEPPALTLVEPPQAKQSVILFSEPEAPAPVQAPAPAQEPERLVIQMPTVPVVPMPQPMAPAANAPTNNFLAKPSNIYQAPSAPAQPMPTQETITEQPSTEPTITWDFTSEDKLPPLELVIRDEAPAEPTAQPVAQIVPDDLFTTPGMQAPTVNTPQPMPQQEDELSKGADRTKKLRSLSFNYNNADSDELENTPAYLRRQQDIHNTLAKVEKFYSDYTVNVDDNNQAQINVNSKNAFLEGEKPD